MRQVEHGLPRFGGSLQVGCQGAAVSSAQNVTG